MKGFLPSLPWPAWVWPWIGGLAAVLTEAYFRAHRDTPYLAQWPPIVLGLLVNYSVYRIMLEATSLLNGFIVFSLATLLLRILATTVWFGEPVTAGTWTALVFLILAKALMWA